MTTRDAVLEQEARTWNARQRRVILETEPDSLEAGIIRQQDKQAQEAQAKTIEAREADERAQQEQIALQNQERLGKAEFDLASRQKRVISLLWYGLAQRPEVVMSPATEAYVLGKLDNEFTIGPDTIERIYAEGIADGSIQTDYSATNRTKHHEFLEAVRSKGNNIPEWLEKPAHSWTDEELAQSAHLLREVPKSEVEGITNFITEHKRKQRSSAADDRDAQNPPPDWRKGPLGQRAWRLMDRAERLKSWDQYRESQ
jgi:hypothetical protein